MAADGGDGSKWISRPTEVYLATERLKELFAGVNGILLVDDEYSCLRGEDVRELLEACGAVRYLRPIEDTSLSWEERKKLRSQAGHAETSGYNDRVTDWSLLGLKGVLDTLLKVKAEQRRRKAHLLWEELTHLEERRGKGVYSGEYTWTHYGSYRTSFDAAFVRMLHTREWVPNSDGNLQRPELVLFDSLDWRPNPFLLSKVRFKPPIIEQLAKEAGIEPGVLDLLKKHGVTSVAELAARLGLPEEPAQSDDNSGAETVEAGSPDHGGGSGIDGGAVVGAGMGKGSGAGRSGEREERGKGSGSPPGERTPENAGVRPFISYVAVHPDEEEPDPDGLNQQARMALEAQAIDLILKREPNWQRPPAFNPGYDLFKTGPDGQPNRWCEVKAMTGSLHDRPVGLSHTQFEYAREHGADYWLYIVEHAGTERARIVRIQDPAGKTRTFTFDQGWTDVAELDSPVD